MVVMVAVVEEEEDVRSWLRVLGLRLDRGLMDREWRCCLWGR
jgi:hypothetical protein